MKVNIEVPVNECSNKRLKSEMRVYFGSSHQTILSCFSIDLNTGGLYLNTDFPFEAEESLTLHFTLSGQKNTVSCKARVAWVNMKDKPRKPQLPPGVGVQFVGLSLEDLKSIQRFLEHNDIEPTW